MALAPPVDQMTLVGRPRTTKRAPAGCRFRGKTLSRSWPCPSSHARRGWHRCLCRPPRSTWTRPRPTNPSVAQLRLQAVQRGHLAHAGRAPGGPEVEKIRTKRPRKSASAGRLTVESKKLVAALGAGLRGVIQDKVVRENAAQGRNSIVLSSGQRWAKAESQDGSSSPRAGQALIRRGFHFGVSLIACVRIRDERRFAA